MDETIIHYPVEQFKVAEFTVDKTEIWLEFCT